MGNIVNQDKIESVRAISDYLDYIRSMHGRLINRSKQDGITTWAIFVGLIYLFWQSIPMFYSVRDDQQQLFLILILFAHMQTIFVSLRLFFSPRGNTLKSKFDYRIPPDFSPPESFLQMFILFVPPIALSIYSLAVGGELLKYSTVQLKSNAIIIGSFFVLFLVVIIWSIRSKHGIRYPSPIFIDRPTSKIERIMLFVIILVLLLYMDIGNFQSLSRLIFSPEVKLESVILSFNIALLIWGVYVLTTRMFIKEQIVSLERLERDVLMHNLSDEEVKKRLEDEHLGLEVGSWLKDEINSIREKARDLSEYLNSVEKFYNEYTALDPSLEYERQGRLERFQKELKSKSSAYLDHRNKLIGWLVYCSPFGQGHN